MANGHTLKATVLKFERGVKADKAKDGKEHSASGVVPWPTIEVKDSKSAGAFVTALCDNLAAMLASGGSFDFDPGDGKIRHVVATKHNPHATTFAFTPSDVISIISRGLPLFGGFGGKLDAALAQFKTDAPKASTAGKAKDFSEYE